MSGSTTTAPDAVLRAMEDEPGPLPDAVEAAWSDEAAAGEAMVKAIAAWESQTSQEYSTDGLEAACWAFHEHMKEFDHGD